MTIYLGNLDLAVTEDQVRELFVAFGEVRKLTLLSDPETGRLRGFGFVEMDDLCAEGAITALDGQEFLGRTLRVNEARNRGVAPPRRSW